MGNFQMCNVLLGMNVICMLFFLLEQLMLSYRQPKPWAPMALPLCCTNKVTLSIVQKSSRRIMKQGAYSLLAFANSCV